MNKSLITIFCILSFTSPAAELFVTEEELDTLVKNFMTDMSNEGIDVDISVSTSSIKGSRDKFNIQNLLSITQVNNSYFYWQDYQVWKLHLFIKKYC